MTVSGIHSDLNGALPYSFYVFKITFNIKMFFHKDLILCVKIRQLIYEFA